MNTYVQTILEDEKLVIEHYRDESGRSFYIGISNCYEPLQAISGNPTRCFFKFAIPLDQQKKLAEKMKQEMRAMPTTSRSAIYVRFR